jgi:hypothetical protein
MKILKIFLCLSLLILLELVPVPTFANGPSALPDGSTCVYVREAGHNIHGAFLEFYASRNGIENFGAPITEAFRENGFIVQYFERARLEFHPENPEPYRVQLGLLVQYEYAGGSVMDPPIKASAIPPASNLSFRYFPDTGLTMSFAIKDYFETHGGVDIFGYPISLLRYENGTFVQYFQRQRLEWTPGISTGSQVRPSSIGQMILDRKYPANFQGRVRAVNDWCPEVSLSTWKPKPFGVVSVPLTALLTPSTPPINLQVYVRFKQTGLTGPQYVDIQVSDPSGKPLPGAALSAIVHFTNGDRVFALLSSDAQGKSALQFDIGVQPAGTATEILVTASAGSLVGSGREIFTR